MDNKESLPKNYQPYDTLDICGNKLIKVTRIVNDKGFTPILIGKDKSNLPELWLSAKSNNGIIKLVEQNNVLLNVVELNHYSNDNKIDLILNNAGEKHILLQIEEIDKEIPKITKIDLRTIGYNIFGNETELNIGNSKMVGNTFQVETLVGV